MKVRFSNLKAALRKFAGRASASGANLLEAALGLWTIAALGATNARGPHGGFGRGESRR